TNGPGSFRHTGPPGRPNPATLKIPKCRTLPCRSGGGFLRARQARSLERHKLEPITNLSPGAEYGMGRQLQHAVRLERNARDAERSHVFFNGDHLFLPVEEN